MWTLSLRLVLVLIALVISQSVFAINLSITRRDQKNVTQVMVERQLIEDATLANANSVLKVQAMDSGSGSAVTTITTFLAQPDVCRTVSITPAGTTNDVPFGEITVSGLNIFGVSISEGISLLANQTILQNGQTAFCSVTSIVFPIQDGTLATYNVGVGNTLGVKRCTRNAGNYLADTFDGVYAGTRGTFLSDSSLVHKNTFEPNGTLNDAKDIELFFFQNFGCLP